MTLYVCTQSLSHARLSVTLWTVAHQAPLSMGFSRQECWSGLPFPSPGTFLTQGLNSCLFAAPVLTDCSNESRDELQLLCWSYSLSFWVPLTLYVF